MVHLIHLPCLPDWVQNYDTSKRPPSNVKVKLKNIWIYIFAYFCNIYLLLYVHLSLFAALFGSIFAFFCNIYLYSNVHLSLFAAPEGKVWEDIWNVGTQYLDNKFYYYEISAGKESIQTLENLKK